MFQNGQKVVCINDQFEAWALVMYDNLPRKDVTYTIRSTSMGRSDPNDTGIDSMVESVTLVELKNPIDPAYKAGEQELQFNANRFVPLEELKDKRKKKEVVHQGEFFK